MIAFIRKIIVYPVKSLDGIFVQSSGFNSHGGLNHDRAFALFDSKGNYVNAKNHPEILSVRTSFDLDSYNIMLEKDKSKATFNLISDTHLIGDWFSDLFGFRIVLKNNTKSGFPDDLDRPGPTVYSYESLQQVKQWFPKLDIDEIRRRFRGNIELSAEAEPFWEDRLLLKGKFVLGDVQFEAVKACPRCPVPSFDSYGDGSLKGFQKEFTTQRTNLLTEETKGLMEHGYMFAINTKSSPGKGSKISTGQQLLF